MIDILLAIESIEDEQEREFIGELFDRYSKRVKALAWGILGNEEDAEDAMGTTFYKVIKYKNKFIGINENMIKGRLKLITQCTCYDMLDKKNGLSVTSISNAVEDDEGTVNDLEIPDDFDILEDIVRRESIEVVMKGLDSLKTPDREIVILRYYDELSNVEIADLLSMNASTVGTNLQRSLAKLKKELMRYYDDKK